MRKDAKLELVPDDRDFNVIILFPDPEKIYNQQHELTSQQARKYRLEYMREFRENCPAKEEWRAAVNGEEESLIWIREYQAAFHEAGKKQKVKGVRRLLQFIPFFGKLTH